MAIKELLSVIAPPDKPVEAGPADAWERIQKQVGIELPSDFRDFGLHYGTGWIDGFAIFVSNPFSADFPEELAATLNRWRTFKQMEAEKEVPYPLHPERPGLLPWGRDDQDTDMFWYTEGHPDKWPVLLRGAVAEWRRFDVSMTTFLARLFRRKIKLEDLFPEEVFENPDCGRFHPLTPRS